MRNLLSLSFGAVLLVLAAGACSSSSSSATASQCNTNPFTCAAGTTCWPIDNAADFGCIKSSAAKAGDACLNTPNAATCGDGLMCLQQSQTGGQCVAYCDSSHGCPTGQTCRVAQIIGTTQDANICYGATPAGDAGTDASTGEDANGGKDSATGGDPDGGTD